MNVTESPSCSMRITTQLPCTEYWSTKCDVKHFFFVYLHIIKNKFWAYNKETNVSVCVYVGTSCFYFTANVYVKAWNKMTFKTFSVYTLSPGSFFCSTCSFIQMNKTIWLLPQTQKHKKHFLLANNLRTNLQSSFYLNLLYSWNKFYI